MIQIIIIANDTFLKVAKKVARWNIQIWHNFGLTHAIEGSFFFDFITSIIDILSLVE